jgi:endonuclease/exonuclease/phosphatase (EEP) superfamily protein YafD
MKLVTIVVVVLGTLLVLVTALPIVPGNDWWVRMWDFPRLQVAALLGLVLLAVPLTLNRRRRRTWGLAFGAAAALAYQLVWIWPHTPLHPVQIALTPSCPANATVRLLTANVLMTSRRAEPLLEHVRRLGPDVVLLVETDAVVGRAARADEGELAVCAERAARRLLRPAPFLPLRARRTRRSASRSTATCHP